MSSTHVIAIVFKLLNFAVIVSLFVYLFRRYVIQWIYSSLAEKKKVVDDLEHMVNVLHAEHESLDRHMQEHELLHHDLNRKLEQWNTRFEQAKKQREQQQAKRREQMARINEIRAHARMLQSIERIVVPQAVIQMTDQLQAKYQDNQASNAFLARIINHLSKETA